MTVYRVTHHHLGNIWNSAHIALRLSARIGETVRLSRWFDKPGDRIDCKDILTEARSLINAPGNYLVLDDDATDPLPDRWTTAYYPTSVRWQPNNYQRICFQFDGKTHPQKTNPSQDDIALLMGSWLPDGWGRIQLGLPVSMTQSITYLAHCAAFLGVDSGIAHLAHSVGTPCFLLEYHEPLWNAHPQKFYIRCTGAADAIVNLRHFLGFEP